MVIKRGNIVYADFGDGEGSQQGGVRPALIIQNDKGNIHSPTTIVAPLTSSIGDGYPFHVFLSRNKYNIKKNSHVLLEQIRVIDKSKVLEYKDTLDEYDMSCVDKALKLSVGL